MADGAAFRPEAISEASERDDSAGILVRYNRKFSVRSSSRGGAKNPKESDAADSSIGSAPDSPGSQKATDTSA
jgi:hypothetical protein